MTSWIAADPAAFAGKVHGNGHCVAYVREAAGAPHTSTWKRGAKVRGGNIAPGTAIATFHNDGYANATDGSSHAAIYLAEAPDGLVVLDQWQGHPVTQRTIRFQAGRAKPCDDGDMFHVIDT